MLSLDPIMASDPFQVTAARSSNASIEEVLRLAMRPAPGRAALHVAPGPDPGLQRVMFSLMREVVQVKGGAILEIGPNDWLLSEAPLPEAERLFALMAKLLPAGKAQLWPLPESNAFLAGILAATHLPKALDLKPHEAVSTFGLEDRLGQIGPASVAQRRSYVSFSGQGKPVLRLQRLTIDPLVLRQLLGRYAEDRALLRHAAAELQARLLEALGEPNSRAALLGGGPAAPLVIDMPSTLLPGMPESEGTAAEPATNTAVYAALALHDAVGIENLATRRADLRKDAWGIAILGLNAKALLLVNPQALAADWLFLDWSEELSEHVSLKILRQLDPARLILDGCKGEAALQLGLELGTSCFGGPWIEDLVAAARMDRCPKARLCTRQECRARGLATAPSGRLGCHMPHLLEAVLPEAAP